MSGNLNNPFNIDSSSLGLWMTLMPNNFTNNNDTLGSDCCFWLLTPHAEEQQHYFIFFHYVTTNPYNIMIFRNVDNTLQSFVMEGFNYFNIFFLFPRVSKRSAKNTGCGRFHTNNPFSL